jgi:NADH:ubiquinone oxidoreductase subunit E
MPVTAPFFDDATVDAAVRRAADAWGREPTQLLQVLSEVQESLGLLPQSALVRIASELGVPIARMRGSASTPSAQASSAT